MARKRYRPFVNEAAIDNALNGLGADGRQASLKPNHAQQMRLLAANDRHLFSSGSYRASINSNQRQKMVPVAFAGGGSMMVRVNFRNQQDFMQSLVNATAVQQRRDRLSHRTPILENKAPLRGRLDVTSLNGGAVIRGYSPTEVRTGRQASTTLQTGGAVRLTGYSSYAGTFIIGGNYNNSTVGIRNLHTRGPAQVLDAVAVNTPAGTFIEKNHALVGGVRVETSQLRSARSWAFNPTVYELRVAANNPKYEHPDMRRRRDPYAQFAA
jgi:hypothetical protein